MLDIHFEQIFAGTDRGDACIGARVDHIGRTSAQLGSGRIRKVAVDREGHPVRVRIAEPHSVDVPWWTDRDVKDVNERLPSHAVVDPDFGLVWPEPYPVLVELPGNAYLSGDLGGTHDVAGGDIPDLEAIDPKEIAVESRLGPIDRVRSPDAGKRADLLEDRIGARVEGVSELLICYPLQVSERNRTTRRRVSHNDYASTTLSLRRRYGY